jgi:NTE family protein
VKTTDFGLSGEKSEALYQSGRKAAEKFFATWNFTEYVAKYRRGKAQIERSLRLRSGQSG